MSLLFLDPECQVVLPDHTRSGTLTNRKTQGGHGDGPHAYKGLIGNVLPEFLSFSQYPFLPSADHRVPPFFRSTLSVFRSDQAEQRSGLA